MTKSESINLFNSLNTLGQLQGVKFAYAVARNIDLLKGDIESLQKALTPTEEFNKFEAERIPLVEKYAKKDADGKPVQENNQYVLEDKEAFEAELNPLKEKYADAIEEREKQIDEYNKLLSEDSTVELFKISINDVPKDISVAQTHGILPIVGED